jgi:hypothetical protein
MAFKESKRPVRRHVAHNGLETVTQPTVFPTPRWSSGGWTTFGWNVSLPVLYIGRDPVEVDTNKHFLSPHECRAAGGRAPIRCD